MGFQYFKSRFFDYTVYYYCLFYQILNEGIWGIHMHFPTKQECSASNQLLYQLLLQCSTLLHTRGNRSDPAAEGCRTLMQAF